MKQFFLIALLFCSGILVQAQTPTAKANLLVWYKLNDASGTSKIVDFSGNLNYGRNHTSPVLAGQKIEAGVEDSQLGKVIGFTATNLNKIITPANLVSGGAARTISFWTKVAALASNAAPQFVLCGGDGTSLAPVTFGKLNISVNAKNIRLLFSGTTEYIEFANTQELRDGRWHHIAVTIADGGDPTGVKCYLEGVELVGTLGGTWGANKINTTSGAIVLGHNYIGNMSDFRIYNKELNATEISSIHAEKPMLVVHYPFDDDAVTQIVGTATTYNVMDKATGTISFDASASFVNTQFLQLRTVDAANGTDLVGVAGQVNGKKVVRFNSDGTIAAALPLSRNAMIVGKNDITGSMERTTTLWVKFDKSITLSAAPIVPVQLFTYGAVGVWKLFYIPGLTTSALRVGTDATSICDFKLTTVLNTDDKWHHIAVVLQGGTTTDNIKLYLDGVEITNVIRPVTPVAINTVNGQLSVGKDLRGWMSEFKMYRGALSAERILSDYTMKPTIGQNSTRNLKTSTGITVNWKFNDGVVASATDSISPATNYGNYTVETTHPYLNTTTVSAPYVFRPAAPALSLVTADLNPNGVLKTSVLVSSPTWYKNGSALADNSIDSLITNNTAGKYQVSYKVGAFESELSNVVVIGAPGLINSVKHLTSSTLTTVVFPTITTGTLVIRNHDQQSKVQILDLSGRIVKTIADVTTGENSIDISDLNSGIYFVRLLASNTVQKIILRK